MNIVLTKDEMFTLSVRKANRRLKDEWIGFIGGYRGEWAVTVHLIRSLSERGKSSDYEAHIKKICGCLKNAINREFHGRRSKSRILFVPVIEGLREFQTTHLHLILGNLGTNNKQRVTKKLAYVFSKNKKVDVNLKMSVRDRLMSHKKRRSKSKNRIRQEALKTGGLKDPTHVPSSRERCMKVERIYSDGWARYILKEQTPESFSVLTDEIQEANA